MEKFTHKAKVMVISNQRTTGPLWVLSLQEQEHLDVVLEPVPANSLHRWAAEIPDLILLDVNLPQSITLELIQSLRRETAVPILMLTTKWDEEFLVDAYRAGIDECISKPIGSSLFHAKVRVWLRRSGSVPTETLDPIRAGFIQLVPADKELVMLDGRRVRLTNLELRLMYCLMSRPDRTAPVEGLIQRVWGSDSGGDNVALKNIVYRLRQKIEVDPGNPLILQTVAGEGYRFVSD